MKPHVLPGGSDRRSVWSTCPDSVPLQTEVELMHLAIRPGLVPVPGTIWHSYEFRNMKQVRDLPRNGDKIGRVDTNGTLGEGEKTMDELTRIRAPELSDKLEWFNTDQALTLRGHRGKVVILDFWSYCCIN